MIRVTNSAEKRIFHLRKYKDNPTFIQLKKEIIEHIKNKEYTELESLNILPYSKHFSIFIFYNTIQSKINSISNNTIRNQLLRLNWFQILVGSIEEIREIIKDNYYILANVKPQVKDFTQYQNIFEDLYKNQLSGKDELKREFFDIFEDINVCPYCNRNFINPIYKKNSVGKDNQKQSPDIEHFFPKSLYPFLALSISNLLPSCAFCNKIKSDVDTFTNSCISPYEIEENDTKFKFEFDSTDIKNRKITLKQEDGIKNSEILHLDSLYNEIHSDYVNDMFTKQKKYPDINKKFLKDKFDLSEDDYKKEFCNYSNEDDFNKHPLSKMTKDLYEHIKQYGK